MTDLAVFELMKHALKPKPDQKECVHYEALAK